MRSSDFSCRILQVWRGRWSRTRSAWRGLPVKVGIIVVVGDAAAGGWLAAGTAETGFCILLEASAVLHMVLINKHCTCHLVI